MIKVSTSDQHSEKKLIQKEIIEQQIKYIEKNYPELLISEKKVKTKSLKSHRFMSGPKIRKYRQNNH